MRLARGRCDRSGMITALSYLGVTSPHADDWRTFGPEILGAQLAVDGPGGSVRLRVDDAVARIVVHPGERDGLAYLGWDVGDAAGLAAAVATVEAAGTSVTPGDDATRAARQVAGLASFVDPFGLRHELSHGLVTGGPFVPGRPISGFVTGAGGLGHVVLLVPDLDAAVAFYEGVLGFRLSDTIESRTRLRFLHCNERHHTLALAAAPGVVGLHHLMLEVASIDDVGTALDLVGARAIPLAMGLGRHTNDLMTSFYVRTPSGFEIEYGTGGRLVDDATWEVGSYEAQSLWGHRPPAGGPLRPGMVRAFAPEARP